MQVYPGGGGGALPYGRWRGRAAGQGIILRSSILAQGILRPSCGHQYWHRVSNSASWIGYWRATPFITGLLPRGSQPTMFMTGPRSGHQRRCNIATGVCIWFFLVRYIVTGCILVHRAVCDRVRFSTPSGTPPPPSTVECPPPFIVLKTSYSLYDSVYTVTDIL